MPDFGPLVVPGEDFCREVQRPALTGATAWGLRLEGRGEARTSHPDPGASRPQALGSSPAQGDRGPSRHRLRPWAKVSKSSGRGQSAESATETSRSRACGLLNPSLESQRLRATPGSRNTKYAAPSPRQPNPGSRNTKYAAPSPRQPGAGTFNGVAHFLFPVRSKNASPPPTKAVPSRGTCFSVARSCAEPGRRWGNPVLNPSWLPGERRTLLPTMI